MQEEVISSIHFTPDDTRFDISLACGFVALISVVRILLKLGRMKDTNKLISLCYKWTITSQKNAYSKQHMQRISTYKIIDYSFHFYRECSSVSQRSGVNHADNRVTHLTGGQI
jgi:hypothetical protein